MPAPNLKWQLSIVLVLQQKHDPKGVIHSHTFDKARFHKVILKKNKMK